MIWRTLRKAFTVAAFACVLLMGLAGVLTITNPQPSGAVAVFGFMFAAFAFEMGAWLAGILERRS